MIIIIINIVIIIITCLMGVIGGWSPASTPFLGRVISPPRSDRHSVPQSLWFCCCRNTSFRSKFSAYCVLSVLG